MSLMTFEQLDRSIDADSDSDDELAEQAHMYRSPSRPPFTYPCTPPSPFFVSRTVMSDHTDALVVMSEKAKSPTSPTFGLNALSINAPTSPPQPARPSAPPRPSATSKPVASTTGLSVLGGAGARRTADSDESEPEDGDDEEDENDPFADRNAVVTPRVERGEPSWP